MSWESWIDKFKSLPLEEQVFFTGDMGVPTHDETGEPLGTICGPGVIETEWDLITEDGEKTTLVGKPIRAVRRDEGPYALRIDILISSPAEYQGDVGEMYYAADNDRRGVLRIIENHEYNEEADDDLHDS